MIQDVSAPARHRERPAATIDNHTGAPHCWFEQTGPTGKRLDVLVVRATFDFAADGAAMTLAQEQHPVVFGDAFAGPVDSAPLRAVIAEDGDLLPYKPGTDILVTGHAYAPDGQARTDWVAGIRVGQTKKILRLYGPRQFRKGLFGWRLGPAQPVGNVALDYRLAYGGCIDVPAALTADGEADAVTHPGNPAGCGWLPAPGAYKHLKRAARKHIAKWVKAQKTLAAPQIEAVMAPVKRKRSTNPSLFSQADRWLNQGYAHPSHSTAAVPRRPPRFSRRAGHAARAAAKCKVRPRSPWPSPAPSR